MAPSDSAVRAACLACTAVALGIACGSVARTPKRPAAVESDNASGMLATSARDPSRLFGGKAYGGKAYGGKAYGEDPDVEAALDKLRKRMGENAPSNTTYGGYTLDYLGLTNLRNKLTRPPPYRGYVADSSAQYTGIVSGRVVWKRPPRRPRELSAPCPRTWPNRSLELDRRRGVARAVVYLKDITRGKDVFGGQATWQDDRKAIQTGGTLTYHGCLLWPRVQLVAPVGADLTVTRGDTSSPVSISWRWTDAPQIHTLTTPLVGRGYTIRAERPGVLELFAAPESLDRAWAVVPRHPYYALTDDAGGFQLREVPEGRYQLVVWHPPLLLGRDPAGQPRFSQPRSRSHRVVVKGTTPTVVKLRLD